jgi:Sec7-like guanine-nucleotide exchange factor
MERASHSLEKSELAAALASHADPFYLEALQACMRRFQFAGNALDIALRKLLMELCLPRETQQIDRVMEAFAKRYTECNEGLFVSHGKSGCR